MNFECLDKATFLWRTHIVLECRGDRGLENGEKQLIEVKYLIRKKSLYSNREPFFYCDVYRIGVDDSGLEDVIRTYKVKSGVFARSEHRFYPLKIDIDSIFG